MRSKRRNKFYLKLFSILFVIASIAFWRTGPEVLPEFLLSIAEAQDDAETEETESQAESVDSSPAKSAIGREPASAASPVQEQQSDAVSLLANEVKALKDMVMSMASSPSAPPGLPTMGASPTRPLEPVDRSPSAPMSALLQFANGTAPAGPISQTADTTWDKQNCFLAVWGLRGALGMKGPQRPGST